MLPSLRLKFISPALSNLWYIYDVYFVYLLTLNCINNSIYFFISVTENQWYIFPVTRYLYVFLLFIAMSLDNFRQIFR